VCAEGKPIAPESNEARRRARNRKIAANRRKYLAAQHDNGVSEFEAQLLRQMNAERQQEKKSVIAI
jgi:hypothetical protein